MASTPPARRAVVPIASASDQFRAGSSLRSPPSSVGGGRTASAARSGASSGGGPARRGSAQSRHGVRSSHGTIRHSGENGAPTSGARGGPSRAPSGRKGTGAGPRDRARPLTSTRSPEKLSGEEPGAANRATGPSKCAACGKSIEGGQRFMELAVTLPKSSSATSQQRKARGKASADLASDGAVVKAPFHLTCLHCSECGQALSDPPPGGASAQDSPIVISTQSAVEVLTGSQAAASQGRGLATKGAAGRKAPATQAALLQYFVAHAKCKERPCAVCHLPIALHDAKIALPDAAPAGEKQKAEPVGHRNRGQRGTQKSAEAAGGEGLRAGRKPGGVKAEETTVYQHVACTTCASCGRGFSPRGDSKMIMLFDEQRRPHHPSCLACCCCRQPLLGRYEIHAFFGKLDTYEAALSGVPALLPLPAGLAAALGAERRVAKLPSHTAGADGVSQQGTITAKHGGLCCTWCAERVPRCICCERRCVAYQTADGEQVLPRAVTKEAIPAANLATAISLGNKRPPAHVSDQGGFAASSNKKTPAKKSAGAAASSELLGEQKGVVCGQCASLPQVTDEAELRAACEWVLQMYSQAGLTFTADMVRLQQLMRTVNEEELRNTSSGKGAKGAAPLRARGQGSAVPSTVKSTSTHANRSLPPQKMKRGVKSAAVSTQIEGLGVPVELVDFSDMNADEGRPACGKAASKASSLTASAGAAGGPRSAAGSRRPPGASSGASALAGRRVAGPKQGMPRSLEAGTATPYARAMFGRCFVQVVTMMVAPEAAASFEDEVKAHVKLDKAARAARSESDAYGARGAAGAATGKGAASSSGGDQDHVRLKHQSTLVRQGLFDMAAAYAAALEGETQAQEKSVPKRAETLPKNEKDARRPGREAAVAAGALLRAGSFAGGLIRTMSGTRTRGLSVRLVERVCVVGSIPRVMVMQHLGHEWLHAYLACKQRGVGDSTIEEGACNVAAAEVLLRFGAELAAAGGRVQSAKASGDYSEGPADAAAPAGMQHEVVIVRYRLWKMKESKDPVYGAGYRHCLRIVSSGDWSFGEFVRWLLKN